MFHQVLLDIPVIFFLDPNTPQLELILNEFDVI